MWTDLKPVLFPKLKPPIFSLQSPSNHQPLVETRTLSQTQTADIPQSKHTHLPTWESLALQMLAIHFNDTTPHLAEDHLPSPWVTAHLVLPQLKCLGLLTEEPKELKCANSANLIGTHHHNHTMLLISPLSHRKGKAMHILDCKYDAKVYLATFKGHEFT